MAKGGRSVVEAVRELAERIAGEQDCFLWDVEYVKEGAGRVLRITIDKEDGVNIDDCERYHRAIDPELDLLDPIEESYRLEVSSPGLERELRTDEHILACEGWDVELRLYAPDADGCKQYLGRLNGLAEDGRVSITLPDGTERCFERAAVAKLTTHYEF